VHIHSGATIRDSLITDGSVICEGALVERSVLSPGVFIGPNAIVRESIIFNDAYVEAGAVVERCIIDKIAVIGVRAQVGAIHDMGDLGITCVGKKAHVPEGYRIGSNCVLGPDVTEADYIDFGNKIVPNGAQVGYEKKTE